MPATRSRLFSWLDTWRPDELQGTLVDIFIADAAGAPMQRLQECRLLPGRGIAGDRYAVDSGHWRSVDACEVTLVSAEAIAAAGRRGAVSFADGEHRRNLVVSGIPLQAYRDSELVIGESLLRFHRLRPPCAYLDRLLRPGAGRALGRAGGIGLTVVQGGTVRVGDRVELRPRRDPGHQSRA